MHGFILLQTTPDRADVVTEIIAEQPGLLGIEELPADGDTLFRPDAAHSFLRFDAREQYEAWLRTEQFREGDRRLLRIYFEASDIVTWKDALLARLTGSMCIAHGRVEPADYLAAMRDQHHGRLIGETFWVGPPWETPPPGKLPVIIEPGTAFGLGDHDTTQMCLELLAGADPARRILDIGTGTGILAIAAAKLFPNSEIWLTDLDPRCQSDVEQNFALNGLAVPSRQFYGDRPPPTGPFDLVLANVYLEALKSLIPVVQTDRWIVSGLLGEDQLAEFQATVSPFQTIRQSQRDRWFALELRR